jgi:hypothetical protein
MAKKKETEKVPYDGTVHSFSYGGIVYPKGDNADKIIGDEDEE